jgi:hypothetical protein
MKVIVTWLILFVCSLVSTFAYADKPVLVELYSTSSRTCATCPDAVNAINQIRSEFPNTLLHFLYFPINDSLQTESGFLRYKIDYLQPPLPTIYFDGSNRITGADRNIDDAYRENVRFQINQPRSGRIYSWQEKSAGAWITRVTYSLPLNIPNDTWELVLVGAKDISNSQVGSLASVVQTVKTVDKENARFDNGWILESVDNSDDTLQFFWFIQKRDPNSLILGEVLLSSRAATQSFISADYTFDGVINHEDLFIFSALWNLKDHQADLNRDGFVDQFDVLLFHLLSLE